MGKELVNRNGWVDISFTTYQRKWIKESLLAYFVKEWSSERNWARGKRDRSTLEPGGLDS